MAVFASLLLTPRASEAACGDYVLVSSHAAEMNHAMPHRESMTKESLVDRVDHDKAGRPCHGPNCSNGRFPPLAPVPTVVVSIERWALASTVTLPRCDSCYNLLAEPVDLIVDGFRLSILRPPR